MIFFFFYNFWKKRRKKGGGRREEGGNIELTRYQVRIKATDQSFRGAGAAEPIPLATGVKGS